MKYLSDWVLIEKQTQEMLELANEGEWQELQQRADERNDALKKFFNKDTPAEYAQDIADGLTRVKGIDEQLTALTQESRDKIRQELLSMSKIKQVRKAYDDNKS